MAVSLGVSVGIEAVVLVDDVTEAVIVLTAVKPDIIKVAGSVGAAVWRADLSRAASEGVSVSLAAMPAVEGDSSSVAWHGVRLWL